MEDYKVRFIKEYRELKERVSKLDNMLTKYDNGTLEFTPAYSISLLKAQFFAMRAYLTILEERAVIEDIDGTIEL